ncbi:formate dehydrogenase accessory sulfurtransferase FdhD [Undibacterium sp.]|uniref:formate dehydrogenase accessory sulfurtransferase FdhD n=1 Tax=Undibacterium sp. TaxID=1914977 RepID=UPI0025E3DAAB|nr:formate dehydrogenase accessory sulfurtransferase FdhD [Undibacterium sp.]
MNQEVKQEVKQEAKQSVKLAGTVSTPRLDPASADSLSLAGSSSKTERSPQLLMQALLNELAAHSEPVSMARLCKRLGVRMSSLLRCVAALSEDVIAGAAGLGLLQRLQLGERELLQLTDKGRASLARVEPEVEPEVESAVGATQPVQVRRHTVSGAGPSVIDTVAEEVPVALVYNGISHAVMMASPLQLEDFAIGFSLSEAIVDSCRQIYDIEIVGNAAAGQGVEVRLTIAAVCFVRLKEKRRLLAGSSGCGICGIESLKAFEAALPAPAPLDLSTRLSAAALLKAFAEMPQFQSINALTGAMHAAAWADLDGNILMLREDVGRHNAMDKLIGAMAVTEQQSGQARPAGFVMMSSRASYELVQKAARAGMPVLATISAPTSLAIKIAADAGITLIGFVRDASFVSYTHTARILGLQD